MITLASIYIFGVYARLSCGAKLRQRLVGIICKMKHQLEMKKRDCFIGKKIMSNKQKYRVT